MTKEIAEWVERRLFLDFPLYNSRGDAISQASPRVWELFSKPLREHCL